MRLLAALRTIALRRSTLWRLLRPFRDRYRPELHYMRGPGPKCAEARARQERGRPEARTRR